MVEEPEDSAINETLGAFPSLHTYFGRPRSKERMLQGEERSIIPIAFAPKSDPEPIDIA